MATTDSTVHPALAVWQGAISPSAYFDNMTDHPDWKGWGYLGGERERARDELRSVVDAAVLDHMVDWSDAERFEWANSRSGRHAADALFSGTPIAKVAGWGLFVKVEPGS